MLTKSTTSKAIPETKFDELIRKIKSHRNEIESHQNEIDSLRNKI